MHSSGIASRFAALAAFACVIALGASGCVSRGALDAGDSRVLEQLANIAPAGAEIDGAVTGVDCWAPSAHLIASQDGGDGELFRVLCRVHYEEAVTTAARYRDMICIGDLASEAVSDHCYRWAYYTNMPRYEDHPGFAAEPARQPGSGPV